MKQKIVEIETWMSKALLLAALLIATKWTLESYHTWMHPEIYFAEIRQLGRDLSWGRFFDCMAISDDCNRTRFLSYLVSYANTYFRVWLWQYVPQHASLSITWPLTIASLYFFYGAIKNLTQDRIAATLATSLYVVSAGFVSMLTLLFNPAKPLVSFFTIFAIWLCTELQQKERWWSWIALYLTMMLSFISDETGWFIYGAMPILFTPLLLRKSPWSFGYFLTFPAFLVFITWVAPILVKATWTHQFNFWQWTFTPTTEISLVDRFSFGALFRNPQTMMMGQTGIVGATIAWALIAWGLFVSSRKSLLVRALVVLVLFALFQSLLTLRQANVVGGTVSTTYYYGALFPVFFLFLLGIAFAERKFIWIFPITLYLAFVSIMFFRAESERLTILHWRIYADLLHIPEIRAKDAWKNMERPQNKNRP